jgi:hypothetical protein
MNKRIRELAWESGCRARKFTKGAAMYPNVDNDLEKFAELIIKKTLDEVAERATVCGDRAWSDELDRKWIELEFGLGQLAEVKNEVQ